MLNQNNLSTSSNKHMGRSLFYLALFTFIGFITLWSNLTIAQNHTNNQRPAPQPLMRPEFWPPHPTAKLEARMNIDAKRQIENMDGEDALPRSREFIRTDSTYYVGWMFEGAYKYNHAADYLGYKNAIVPLEKAMRLLEKDYSKALSTRTDNILTYIPIRILQPDYTMLAYYLQQCYSNTDQPEKVYALARRVLKWKFQAQFSFDAYNYLAWTTHRNRFYTKSKYSFLGNSIDENEQIANRYLDTSLILTARNKYLNEALSQYMPFFKDNDEREKMSVYHYKNILYSYAFNIDSANYYFELMRSAGRLPHNNYANFRGICGDFKTQEEEYKIASRLDPSDKRLQEWAYYTSILDIYKAEPKTGATLSKDMIRAAGSTPGYGWYNIALARCMLYDGQISESDRYTNKAAEFKEVHIGTTLGQSHYDFSIQLLKLMQKELSWQMDKFEHKNWWYNPKILLSMSSKLSEKYLQQFLIINQFAENPERDRVIYKLFSTESTVSWDEIWYLVHDFSTDFFIRRFKKEAETDKRAYIRKYFELFVARLEMQQGKYKESKAKLDKLLNDPDYDTEYEKLFTARIYQAEAECAKELKDETGYNNWLYRLYVLYPQLLPYTGMKANMALHLSGDIDKEVESSLKDCNIEWVTNSSIPAPGAYIHFTRNGNKKDITYYVIDRLGNYIIPKQTIAWQKPAETGTSLAYRLFNIGGKEPEKEEVKEEPKAKVK